VNGKTLHPDAPTGIACSSNFRKRIFGWNMPKRGNGSAWFDDITGEREILDRVDKIRQLTNQLTRGFSLGQRE
jgi:hypothetical protein